MSISSATLEISIKSERNVIGRGNLKIKSNLFMLGRLSYRWSFWGGCSQCNFFRRVPSHSLARYRRPMGRSRYPVGPISYDILEGAWNSMLPWTGLHRGSLWLMKHGFILLLWSRIVCSNIMCSRRAVFSWVESMEIGNNWEFQLSVNPFI